MVVVNKSTACTASIPNETVSINDLLENIRVLINYIISRNMRTKILTKEEKEFLETVTSRILEPIKGVVHIPEKYTTIHCSRSTGTGSDRVEWDEYIYHIIVESDKGNFEFSESFHDFAKLPGIAWHLAASAFHELDNDLNGPLAENLWPRDNNLLPDCERFLADNN